MVAHWLQWVLERHMRAETIHSNQSTQAGYWTQPMIWKGWPSGLWDSEEEEGELWTSANQQQLENMQKGIRKVPICQKPREYMI
jgi:hypothetical protein